MRRLGGYYLKKDGKIDKDNYIGNKVDPITLEPIEIDPKKRITWNGRDFYNLNGDDAAIKKWLRTNNTDPVKRKKIDYVRTHFGITDLIDSDQEDSDSMYKLMIIIRFPEEVLHGTSDIQEEPFYLQDYKEDLEPYATFVIRITDVQEDNVEVTKLVFAAKKYVTSEEMTGILEEEFGMDVESK
jgi:hypothetical protein